MVGQEILFIHTEPEAPDSALADVYVFTNGVTPADAPSGPMGFQGDVFLHVPGDPGYSPLRTVHQVRWNDDAKARLLRSAPEVTAAADAGQVAIERPGIVINMPFVR
ncbi:hypothetical protein SAMN05661080_04604 [Modestobacter sp. DSM 44400]|uniref:DUF7482 domain-containing protein n=1 Tax=Modestobacter sp. DSM 44400 TaxID=1550230 RepID=UPI0008954022|nr:hypothetical protein [Modestobacter sp. DSM 44400]SDY78576.1 hypothetical protein SAMN05661080_04604 [Modestobacter sp. DSM 44400]